VALNPADLGVQDLKALIEALAVVVGGAASLYHWRLFGFRDRLKTDLEILKEYDSVAKSTKGDQLRSHIDATVDRMYPQVVGEWPQTFPWLDSGIGVSCVIVALIWLKYFGVLEDWRHAMIVVLLMFLGTGALWNAYERWHHVHASRRALRSRREATHARAPHQTMTDDLGRRRG
jgi:hypothetical protein